MAKCAEEEDADRLGDLPAPLAAAPYFVAAVQSVAWVCWLAVVVLPLHLIASCGKCPAVEAVRNRMFGLGLCVLYYCADHLFMNTTRVLFGEEYWV